MKTISTKQKINDELFIKTIQEYVGEDAEKIGLLAKKLKLPKTYIKHWISGERLPLPIMRKYIINAIKEVRE